MRSSTSHFSTLYVHAYYYIFSKVVIFVYVSNSFSPVYQDLLGLEGDDASQFLPLAGERCLIHQNFYFSYKVYMS